MTPEERKEALDIFSSAVLVANKFGPLIIEETDGYTPVTTTTAAILLAGFCNQAGMSLHDTVDLLMSAYKSATELTQGEP